MRHFLKILWECFSVWHLKGTEDLSSADCIVAHAGAETNSGHSGRMNKILGEKIKEILRDHPLPVIAQGELAKHLEGIGVRVFTQTPRQLECKEYIDTVWVTNFFKKICDQNGWKKPVLLSYHPHLWRGKMVAEKLGMEVIIPLIQSGIYDPECSQWWMRSSWFNTPREIACRLVWLLQGKI